MPQWHLSDEQGEANDLTPETSHYRMMMLVRRPEGS